MSALLYVDENYSDLTSGLSQEFRFILKEIHETISDGFRWGGSLSEDDRQSVGLLVCKFICELVHHYSSMYEWKGVGIQEMKVHAAVELQHCVYYANTYGTEESERVLVNKELVPIIDKFLNLKF